MKSNYIPPSNTIKIAVSGQLIEFIKTTTIIPYFGIIFDFAITLELYLTGDDQALLNGLQSAINCLSGTPPQLPCGPGVLHFPFFQYLIGLPFKLTGFSDLSIKQFFGWLSVFWTLLAGATFWRIGVISSGKPGGHLGLLLLLSGYLVWYMTATFNEAASFALLALLVLSVIDRWRIIPVCCVAFACTVTKEVAFPFVLYFMFLSFYARELRTGISATIFHRVFKFLVDYKFVICAIFLGVTANLAFNYFRFESISNVHNLNPILFTPWEYVPITWSYLFISPAAGLIFTWLSLCLLLVFPLIFLMRDRAEILLVCFCIFGLMVANIGLARWFSPFGWVAWGPRLTLPFLGAVGALGVYLAAPKIIAYVQKSNKGSRVIVVFLLIVVSSLPNISVLLDPGAFYTKLFAPGEVVLNSDIPNFTVQTAPAPLYQEATLEAARRNIILPTTIEIVIEQWRIIAIWVVSLFFICRQLSLPDRGGNGRAISSTISSTRYAICLKIKLKRKTISIGVTNKAAIILTILLLFISSALHTRTDRESCSACFDFWHEVGLGKVTSQYTVIPSSETVLKGLENFPSTPHLGKIQIKLNEALILDSIFVSAIDQQGNDAGNWTTRPVSHLWGVGVLLEDKIINKVARIESLKIPINQKLSLLIPNNGNLLKGTNLYIRIYFNGGQYISTLAAYDD